jgi:hypothetical protein
MICLLIAVDTSEHSGSRGSPVDFLSTEDADSTSESDSSEATEVEVAEFELVTDDESDSVTDDEESMTFMSYEEVRVWRLL